MKILVAGDFAPKFRVAAKIEEGDYSCLEEIKPIIQEADYSIVNFESPVVMREAKPIEKTGPNLRCTERAMECLAQAGFNCVTLANNHFRDYGQIGVEDTLAACNRYGIDHVGGGRNLEEAQWVLYKELVGQKLAIVNICENEWSIAGTNQGGSAPINLVWNYYTIQEARNQADYVLVIVHGGIEGYQYPTPRMVDTYRFFIDAGADVVVNHHQHCYSGYEDYKNKHIFYGLGNFCLDRKRKPYSAWNEGYIVMINIDNNKIEYNVIPCVQCAEKPAVMLMNGSELRNFNDEIKNLNDIIGSSVQLSIAYEKLLDRKRRQSLMMLEPLKNRLIHSLQWNHFFPMLNSYKQYYLLFNMMSCESHREKMISILRREIHFFNN